MNSIRKCGRIILIMDTRIVSINESNIDGDLITEAGNIIKTGGLVAFPTETVYGLGGDALNPASSEKIYAAKGRPSDNPLIVHIAEMDSLEKIADKVPEGARKLADKYWPGPLTMIFKKSDEVPYETTGGLDTVAVRMPVHKTALEFIKASGGYVAAPSANISGRPSPTCAKYVIEDMQGRIDMIIDGGDSGIGLESTIVDMTGDKPIILRPGYITEQMLKDVLGDVDMDPTIMDGNCKDRPKAPGMRYRHYAPKAELTIVSGEEKSVIAYILRETNVAVGIGKRVGIICTDESVSLLDRGVLVDRISIKSVGSRTDEESIAHRLYTILREFDDESVDVIFSESFNDNDLGQAIMNRLLKAAGHQVVRLWWR